MSKCLNSEYSVFGMALELSTPHARRQPGEPAERNPGVARIDRRRGARSTSPRFVVGWCVSQSVLLPGCVPAVPTLSHYVFSLRVVGLIFSRSYFAIARRPHNPTSDTSRCLAVSLQLQVFSSCCHRATAAR